MSRRPYPEYFKVEFTGDAQGMEWDGTVSAYSRNQALILATVKAVNEGVNFTTGTHAKVELITDIMTIAEIFKGEL